MTMHYSLKDTADWVCLNGELIHKNNVQVSPFDRGFLFADGIYEGIGLHQGKPINSEAHYSRLTRSLEAIALPKLWDYDALFQLLHKLTQRNNCQEGFCYLQITRGAAHRDFPFPDKPQPQLFMFLQPKDVINNPQAKTGVPVCCVPDTRWKRRSIKSIALLPQVLAKQQAKEAGGFEAWMVENGEVTEGASTSAFIINADGELQTAPLSDRILPGVTRAAIVRIAQDLGIPVREAHFTPTDAYRSREAFLTSASLLVLPIISVDGKAIGNGAPGPITNQLRRTYIERHVAITERVAMQQ